jgi:hypothetical protein
VPVREPRHRTRLAPEALDLVGVGGDLTMHELYRHPAFERLVERPVHGRHPARADLLFEPEARAEEGADHRFRILGPP